MKRQQAWLAASALFGLIALLMPDVVSGRGVFFERDVESIWYSRVASLMGAAGEGAWPLWDAHAAFGLPALANPSYQVAYPPTWVALVVPLAWSYSAFVVLHLVFAGCGLWRLARRLGLSAGPAWFAAAAWVACGPLLSFANLWHHFAGLTWMPWVLLTFEGLLDRPSRRSGVALGLAGAGQILAGSGDMALATLMVAIVRVALRDVRPLAGRAREMVRSLGPLVIAGVVALSASAVQWLPFVAGLAEGSRLRMPRESNLYWSEHPLALADLFVPRLVADFEMSDELRALVFQSREPLLISSYLGMAALASALLASFLGARRARADVRRWTLVAAALLLLCALGSNTPAYPLLVRIPPFDLMRYPAKYLGGASLVFALLVGLGLDVWQHPWTERERGWGARVALILAALAACLGLCAAWTWLRPADFEGWLGAGGRIAPSGVRLAVAAGVAIATAFVFRMRTRNALAPASLTTALVLLTLADLVAWGRGVNRLAPPALINYKPAWISERAAIGRPHRLYVIPPRLSYRDSDQLLGAHVGAADLALPPRTSRWGLDGSFDGALTGLESRALGHLSAVIESARGTPLALRLLQMGAVREVASLSEEPWLDRAALRIPSVFANPIHVSAVPNPLPRTLLVSGVRVANDEQVSYAVLLDPAFDFRREVLLSAGRPRASVPGFEGHAREIWRRADALAVETDASHDAVLVVVDGYDAGWKATVDGVRADVVRANTLFRAIPVPPGRHVVELHYRPAYALAGGLVSLSSFLTLFFTAWRVSVVSQK